MRSVLRHLAAGALAVIVFPAVCFAQFGTIAGVVKDSSGAVLPGVTVEAASPALIEKTRTAVSDSAGQYSVPQLRPGVYTVTFTLTGFSSVRRDGIEISAGFAAPVNASLKVGAVSETITVTGASAGGGRAEQLRTEAAREGSARRAADGAVVRDGRDDAAGRDGEPARCGRHAGRARERPRSPRRHRCST